MDERKYHRWRAVKDGNRRCTRCGKLEFGEPKQSPSWTWDPSLPNYRRKLPRCNPSEVK